MSNVIVIGGGAAGMMAAIAAAKRGHRVSLYEKNEKLGKKLYITGKGRCNVTNACDTQDLFGHMISNPKFLYSSFYAFSNYQMMDFLEQAGLPLKTERGERVFPLSDKSSDVIKALATQLRKLGVTILLNTSVNEVLSENGHISGIRIGKEKITADAVVVATGGLSYASTGSTGDGYSFAKKNGHTVQSCSPSLVPFEIKEAYVKELQGLSLKNVRMNVILVKEGKNPKTVYSDFGEMMFTHFGVTGPLVLTASAFVKQWTGKADSIELRIDLKPALDEEQLDERIQKDFRIQPNASFKNSLGKLLPRTMIPVIVRLSHISPDKKVHDITKEERLQLIQVLKAFPMTYLKKRGYSEAVITQGGVTVKEVNPSTMESKLTQGLYFAGEVLDLDAVTGGFNLQIAWSTGYLAGDSIE